MSRCGAKGAPSVTRSFHSKSDALAWARKQELEADHRHPDGPQGAPRNYRGRHHDPLSRRGGSAKTWR